VNKKRFNPKKEKIILFVGKLNPSKGFDLFCNVITKILDEFPKWKSYVIGDEPRAKIDVSHQNLFKLGFQKHEIVLQYYDRASIAVGCSKWDEPMGRVGLESSSRGCATIVSNKGGLPETITNGIILNDSDEEQLYLSLKKLVSDNNYRKKLCSLSYKNFKNETI
jgi:glycosyltransferase involved in cell wall biosynthesis